MLSENDILRLIDEDSTSEKKRFARIGQCYYEGDHDIKNYQLFYYNADGDFRCPECGNYLQPYD